MQEEEKNERKGVGGNGLFLILISCWLLFTIYVGFKGGG